MNNTPLVSVIIPAHNRAKLIGETLDSVLAQTYQNWECIVVDDGSSDNTKKIVQHYVDKDPRFILVDRPVFHKPGGSGSRNYGFEISRGEFIQFLDSDDLINENKLELQLSVLLNSSRNYSICGNFTFENYTSNIIGNWSNSDIISSQPFKSFLQNQLSIQTASPVFRKAFLKKIDSNYGLFNENLKQSQEWELFCRILFIDPHYEYTKKHLLYIRKNEDSITNKFDNNSPEIIYSEIQALRLVRNFLRNKRALNDELKAFFINRGVSIWKKLYVKSRQQNDCIDYCEKFILECFDGGTKNSLYKFKFQLGKIIWIRTKRGNKLLNYP